MVLPDDLDVSDKTQPVVHPDYLPVPPRPDNPQD